MKFSQVWNEMSMGGCFIVFSFNICVLLINEIHLFSYFLFFYFQIFIQRIGSMTKCFCWVVHYLCLSFLQYVVSIMYACKNVVSRSTANVSIKFKSSRDRVLLFFFYSKVGLLLLFLLLTIFINRTFVWCILVLLLLISFIPLH